MSAVSGKWYICTCQQKKSPGGETEIWAISRRHELEIFYIYMSALHYAKYIKRTRIKE